MPEILSVTKHIHVMVGITRSKVIAIFPGSVWAQGSSNSVKTPWRTEQVDFSKKLKKKNTIKNRITEKTTWQEEPPEKSKKNKKKNQNLHFP